MLYGKVSTQRLSAARHLRDPRNQSPLFFLRSQAALQCKSHTRQQTNWLFFVLVGKFRFKINSESAATTNPESLLRWLSILTTRGTRAGQTVEALRPIVQLSPIRGGGLAKDLLRPRWLVTLSSSTGGLRAADFEARIRAAHHAPDRSAGRRAAH